MNLRRKSKVHSEVSTHSLNDIMFFLMLFFLIASTMANPNVVKLMLPSAKSTQTVIKKPISISIKKDLSYWIDTKQILPSELESALLSKTTGLTDPAVVIRVDKDIPVQYLVDILDIGNKLKIKMVLATQPKA
ncbi:MAG: biopolymer transporter ExbD [Cytophagales bacterium]|nr:MAG: biopolymer transporter ExbD [Cytophagales bacterium]